MTDETSNLLQFPRINPGYASSPEIMELLAGITALLRAAERVSQLTAATPIEDTRKLMMMIKIKAIVAEASSLYLSLMNNNDESLEIRTRIESIINDLDKL